LFTLVGIAGEDDLDAPDLASPQQQSPGPERAQGNGSLNGGQLHAPYPAAGRSTAKVHSVPREPALSPEASAELRDRLLGELNELASGDDAELWAHRSLSEKNKLTTADAGHIEEAFRIRLTAFATPTVGTATKERGGKKLELIRCRGLVRCGLKLIRRAVDPAPFRTCKYPDTRLLDAEGPPWPSAE
jgi:hypothetical protein